MEQMGTETNSTAYLAAYGELCNSYHAIDDFRMKLLGFLPLTSLVGIFGLSTDSLFAQANLMSRHLITFIAVFAAAFTLALFVYEIRGILRCSDLVRRGMEIETTLSVRGQFYVCVAEHEIKQTERSRRERAISFFDSKFAASLIYSTVFAAWVFTALRFGLNRSTFSCTFIALGMGLVLGVSVFNLVRRLVAA